MQGLKGKVALVAGAATGLGAASARRLAQEGARVVVGDVNQAGAEQTADAIRALGGDAIAAAFDISSDESVRSLAATAVAAYGGVDLVHVNAGAMDMTRHDSDVVDIDLDVWDRTIAVNLRGHMLVTRHSVPALLARGGGAIVYTSSVAAFTGEATRPAYSATKAGINALMRHVAQRWGREGIRANAVAPSLIVTDTIRASAPEGLLEGRLAMTPSTRHGEESDVASMVAYLMSDEGSWINGQVINIDGGRVMR
ncbi:MAG TPA: SDR family NAD(P)-dependent oxidoreductase [Trebonia sp.]|jgi:NAD(P)-dependent dehydrogenase (short-subunit alcohol dehydrogenase family)|nr:SDR family NAD(P)-dependent oxidoreductase [Trebonia sp.]